MLPVIRGFIISKRVKSANITWCIDYGHTGDDFKSLKCINEMQNVCGDIDSFPLTPDLL